MVVARPLLQAVGDIHRLRRAADRIRMMQLAGIDRRLVDQAPIERRHHLQALGKDHLHAGDGAAVDLLRLGFVHGAQLAEIVRLLVLHRDAGLLGERLAVGGHDRLLPRAAIAEIGDRLFVRLRREHSERRQQRRRSRGLAERLEEFATVEALRFEQQIAQACAGFVDTL